MKRITDNDLAGFIVCPEAWRIKRLGSGEKKSSENQQLSAQERDAWLEKNNQFAEIKIFAKVVYVLLFLLFLTVLTLDQLGRSPVEIDDIFGIPPQIITILLLLSGSVFLTDIFERKVKNLGNDTGIDRNVELVGDNVLLKSSDELLTSQPDAIVKDGESIIPVDRIPTQSKVRDRHVIKMLLHLKLLEERNGKQSPYGLLVMGEKKRQSKILNNQERQDWLNETISQLREVEISDTAEAKPEYRKCKSCDVNKLCEFSAFLEKP